MRVFVVCLGVVASVGCGGEESAEDQEEPAPATSGLPVLGSGAHSIDAVRFDRLSQPTDPLHAPRDLALNPDVPNQLWVVNRTADSITVFENLGLPDQTAQEFKSEGNHHFLAQPSGIAMGKPGFFATIHETDDKTQGADGTPEDFMGPTLWTTDPAIFDGGHGGHMDMMHNSPNGMGIAWERDNVYWVFDGYHGSLSRYDFAEDHGPGGADHSDGSVLRYVNDNMAWVEDVPSHLEYDHATDYLYAADTGNNRVVGLDTKSGTVGRAFGPSYDDGEQHYVDGTTLWTLVDGATVGMVAPCGLALHEGLLFVGDHATSTIYGFTLDGALVDWLETGLPAGHLMGLELDPEGNLLVVDAVDEAIYRISPTSE
jgi:hypothetical protein